MQSQRLSKINATLQREISQVLVEIHKPQWGIVTVADVQISPDLHSAKIWLEASDKTINMIKNSVFMISKRLHPRLKIKYQPALEFIKDTSNIDRIEALLEQLNESKKRTL